MLLPHVLTYVIQIDTLIGAPYIELNTFPIPHSGCLLPSLFMKFPV